MPTVHCSPVQIPHLPSSAVAAGQCLGVSWGERSEVRGTGRGARARAAASHTGPSLHLCISAAVVIAHSVKRRRLL